MGPKRKGYFEPKPGRFPRHWPQPATPSAGALMETRSVARQAPTICKDALHGFTGNYVRNVVDAGGADTAAALGSVLVTMGAVLNRGPYLRYGYTSHRTTLFAATVSA